MDYSFLDKCFLAIESKSIQRGLASIIGKNTNAHTIEETT